MKKHLIALTLIFALTLTACSKNEATPDNGTVSTTQSETESATESSAPETAAPDTENTENTGTENTSEDTENDFTVPKEDYPDYLCGPGGDKISADEITSAEYYGVGEKWDYAVCEGFVYLAEPKGVTYNSIDNADIYDSKNFAFIGAPEVSETEYKRYRVGDTVCGLTLRKALTSFSYDMGANKNNPEGYFSGGTACFDGAAELSGYLVILVDYEYAIGDKGDVIFVPDSEGQILPVMNYDSFSEERGVYSSMPERCFSAGGLVIQSEYPFVLCGNVDDYDSSMFSAIEHNTPTHVKLTGENIMMDSGVDWFAKINLTVTDLEIL